MLSGEADLAGRASWTLTYAPPHRATGPTNGLPQVHRLVGEYVTSSVWSGARFAGEAFTIRDQGDWLAKRFADAQLAQPNARIAQLRAVCELMPTISGQRERREIERACICVSNEQNGLGCEGQKATVLPPIRKSSDDTLTTTTREYLNEMQSRQQSQFQNNVVQGIQTVLSNINAAAEDAGDQIVAQTRAAITEASTREQATAFELTLSKLANQKADKREEIAAALRRCAHVHVMLAHCRCPLLASLLT